MSLGPLVELVLFLQMFAEEQAPALSCREQYLWVTWVLIISLLSHAALPGTFGPVT